MATAEQLATLRRITNEPTTDTYTDATLLALIDSEGGVNQAAAAVWREKAAKASTLVNVSESGSSRSMQNIHQNALSMVKYYEGLISPVATTDTSPFVVGIERQ